MKRIISSSIPFLIFFKKKKIMFSIPERVTDILIHEKPKRKGKKSA